MHRRELIQLFGATAAARLWPRFLMPPRRIGVIGLQLYTVRKMMERNVEATLSAVSAIGYREVELNGLYGLTPAAMRQMLDRNHLLAPSSHISLEDMRANWPRTLDAAAILGQKFIVLPWLDEKDRTPDGMERIVHDLNTAGEVALKAGIQLAYHNHDFEFKPVNGAIPYATLLAKTDPKLVKFELDLYWVVEAGQDPRAYIEKYPGRFPLLHVKDRSAEGKMADVGQGVIDFKKIFAKAGRSVQHYFVEHDEPPSPIDDARISYEYLHKLSF
ncbi:MAG: sugar phosphate isomerase/epimerase [Gemmatimonadota bacterium]|nr:sugar phosphate isomerase/epimerase [Gemmatimonadota bacterium]